MKRGLYALIIYSALNLSGCNSFEIYCDTTPISCIGYEKKIREKNEIKRRERELEAKLNEDGAGIVNLLTIRF